MPMEISVSPWTGLMYDVNKIKAQGLELGCLAIKKEYFSEIQIQNNLPCM